MSHKPAQYGVGYVCAPQLMTVDKHAGFDLGPLPPQPSGYSILLFLLW